MFWFLLVVIGAAVTVFFRITLYFYRYRRAKQLKYLFDQWLTTGLKDKRGNRISIFDYSHEITKLVQASGKKDYIFSAQKRKDTFTIDAKALQEAIGIFKYELKQSLYPITYLKLIVNLPKSISKVLGIPLCLASLFLILLILFLTGFLDISTFIDKLIDIFA